ncbi:ribosome-binding factor A [Dokdonia pacifica]|uniref:Ribosome-binding factor A n=1 Tax=Dokdonia pacifica TaxID=1627892 RepID=A0A239AH49_9FLAO|nr:30S ribosome-binding factor RbfA [Dokdonia pacifica]GGG37811.1 ribosome-binding factor A [Dokdonia pacifica]SNR94253.1 ribosome-binding factor A [Dokdonia pacifica]
MESNRQKKVAGVLQKDLADVLQNALRDSGHRGIIVSVSKVKVPTDLSIAKVYISVFPNAEAQKMLEELNLVKPKIRHEISQRTRHQLRRMPELQFYIDDSLEYMEEIDRSLKGIDNPIEDPTLLEKRKKS